MFLGVLPPLSEVAFSPCCLLCSSGLLVGVLFAKGGTDYLVGRLVAWCCSRGVAVASVGEVLGWVGGGVLAAFLLVGVASLGSPVERVLPRGELFPCGFFSPWSRLVRRGAPGLCCLPFLEGVGECSGGVLSPLERWWVM